MRNTFRQGSTRVNTHFTAPLNIHCPSQYPTVPLDISLPLVIPSLFSVAPPNTSQPLSILNSPSKYFTAHHNTSQPLPNTSHILSILHFPSQYSTAPPSTPQTLQILYNPSQYITAPLNTSHLPLIIHSRFQYFTVPPETSSPLLILYSPSKNTPQPPRCSKSLPNTLQPLPILHSPSINFTAPSQYFTTPSKYCIASNTSQFKPRHHSIPNKSSTSETISKAAQMYELWAGGLGRRSKWAHHWCCVWNDTHRPLHAQHGGHSPQHQCNSSTESCINIAFWSSPDDLRYWGLPRVKFGGDSPSWAISRTFVQHQLPSTLD